VELEVWLATKRLVRRVKKAGKQSKHRLEGAERCASCAVDAATAQARGCSHEERTAARGGLALPSAAAAAEQRACARRARSRS
jgi:F0F1-type ATP synthase membrane subunit b/b'